MHKNVNNNMTTNYKSILTLLDEYSNISNLPESDISEMVSKSLRLNRLKVNCQMWIDENPDCYKYLKIIPGLRRRFVAVKTKQIFRSSLITLFGLSVLLLTLHSIFSVFPGMGDGKILVTIVLSLGYIAWLGVMWTRRCAQ